MLRLSKKIEYALVAMQYITANSSKIVPAKEISENTHISFEFLAKTLQKLMKSGLIVSVHGVNGGYKLGKKADNITIADIILALEGKTSIVDCFVDNKLLCTRISNCTIKSPMKMLQKKIDTVFHTTTIAEISHVKTQMI
ncbi:MAG: Rrf2 family transcriptional regulator [FCB group bacterium]|jgi:Rrf2 family protein